MANKITGYPRVSQRSQSIPEYPNVAHGIPGIQNTPEYPRVSQSIPEYPRVSQVSKNIPEYSRLFQCLKEYSGVPFDILGYPRASKANPRMPKLIYSIPAWTFYFPLP